MLRLALPNKGRLTKDIYPLFADAGLPLGAESDRTLRVTLADDLEAIFVRTQDIPEFVADGAAQAGITGWDLVEESGREVVEVLDLGLGRCRLVVAAAESSGIGSLADVTGSPNVATSYPGITRRFFESRGIAVKLVPVSGATEITPHLGVADLIVDLVSTGSTLARNNLVELETIGSSSARLIARPKANRSTEDDRTITELATALTSVLQARGKRYLMANVPRGRLDDMREVIPGLGGPTVVDILNHGDHVAVHAVIPADDVYRTTSRLQRLGARGILVTRIERLLP